MDKAKDFSEFFNKLKDCTRCLNIYDEHATARDRSLINFWNDREIGYSVPTIWTDWHQKLDARVLVVGQDWGPISDIKKISHEYKTLVDKMGEDQTQNIWRTLARQVRSNTGKKLLEFMHQSARLESIAIPSNFVDYIYITNAVLCARQGEHYRGDHNFAAKISVTNCQDFLKRQIELVQPYIVMTLGWWALKSVADIFKLSLSSNLTKSIQSIQSDSGFVIANMENGQTTAVTPLFHPAAMRSNEDQVSDYRFIWKTLLKTRYNSIDQLLDDCFSTNRSENDLDSDTKMTQQRLI